jgi:hypothetical protein
MSQPEQDQAAIDAAREVYEGQLRVAAGALAAAIQVGVTMARRRSAICCRRWQRIWAGCTR